MCYRHLRFEGCKCFKIRLRAGLRCGAYSALKPLAGFRGGAGREGEGKVKKMRKRERERRVGEGRTPNKNPGYGPGRNGREEKGKEREGERRKGEGRSPSQRFLKVGASTCSD